VVLVGHSFGGSVVSRVAEQIPDRLKRLVFHTAFVVQDGASVNDNFPPEQTKAFSRAAAGSPDNTVACSWEVSATSSCRTPRRTWRARSGASGSPAVHTVGREARPEAVSSRRAATQLYRCARRPCAAAGGVAPDHVLPLGDFKLVEMGGSHEVMFTRPAELARKLIDAAND